MKCARVEALLCKKPGSGTAAQQHYIPPLSGWKEGSIYEYCKEKRSAALKNSDEKDSCEPIAELAKLTEGN